jgi:signal peptide peptidase SppA
LIIYLSLAVSKKRRKNKRKSRKGNGPDSTPLGPIEQLYDDIYDDLSTTPSSSSPLQKLFGMSKSRGDFDKPTSKLNIGIPPEYLKVTKLNSRYDSYRYSMIKATRGKAVAASELRSKAFENALGKALGVGVTSGGLQLTFAEGTQLLQLERDFLKEGSELLGEVAEYSREITNAAVLEEMESMGVEAGVIDALVNDTVIDAVIEEKQTEKEEEDKKENVKPKKKKIEKQGDIMRAVKELEAINTQIFLLELDFIQSVVELLGPNRADAIRTALVGNMINGEAGTLLKSLKERPLASIFSSFFNNEPHRKNLYVTRFPGDVTASQLNELREEVTGILRAAQPNDEVLLILQSGGGTVTGYGLAAAQLQRFKEKGMKLTICVEQVAASGGYMMCCTADRIVASPFAVLGSIGVISEIPNAYERLKQEGIEFQTITAGKYKRTVTPTKKVTREDIKKSEEDINDILTLFKAFVKSQRPQLDIDKVATGETWFGEMALEKGLCDELATADDVLLDFVDSGYDVYEVAYNPPPEGIAAFAGLPGRTETKSNGWQGVLRSAVRSVVSEVKAEVVSELNSNWNEVNSIERRYMAKDPSDASGRVQMRD